MAKKLIGRGAAMKVQTISLQTFMRDHEQKSKPSVSSRFDFKAYSVMTVSPTAFLDGNIMTLAGMVLFIALLEKFLEHLGLYDVKERLAQFLRWALSLGFGLLLFWFLCFNPFMSWM